MKAARHARRATHPHHGTLLRVSPSGRTSEVVAYGFRASNGLGIEPGPVLYGTDQEGHWMPANRLNRIKPGEFHGNVWGWTPDNTLEKYVPPSAGCIRKLIVHRRSHCGFLADFGAHSRTVYFT